MGQKYAAFDAQADLVVFYDSSDSPVPAGISAIAITDEQWQVCLATPGYAIANNALVPPTSAQLLASARTMKIAVLASACTSAITSGFSSSALGSAHNYPSMITDQTNQGTVASNPTGGLLWCETGSSWAFIQHTQAQAQTVVGNFATYLNSCQSRLVSLTGQVNAAATVAAVQAIGWAS